MEFTWSEALSSSYKTAWHFERDSAQSWFLIPPCEVHSCLSGWANISLDRRYTQNRTWLSWTFCHAFTFSGPKVVCLFFVVVVSFFIYFKEKKLFSLIVSIFESLFSFSAFSLPDTALSVPWHLSIAHLHLFAMFSLSSSSAGWFDIALSECYVCELFFPLGPPPLSEFLRILPN